MTPEPSADHCLSTLKTYTYLTFNGQIINRYRWNETNLNDILIEENIQFIHKIPIPVRWKNREKSVKEKQSHTYIYMVRYFAYVYGVVRISLFTRKNTRGGSTVFSLKKTQKPLISKTIVFLSLAQDLQWVTNGPKIYFGLGHNLNQTQLGSTKLNIDIQC